MHRKRYILPLPPSTPGAWTGRELVLGDRTLIMGIINVTPDSFADGGLRFDPARAVEDGLSMLEDGAHLLDVGGESTRPGAEAVSEAEELRRVLPVVEKLAARPGAVVSVDTYKAVVAREAVARGAAIVNDVSGLQYDETLASTVAESGAALVLMHNRGRSHDMYGNAVYDDVVREVVRELHEAVGRAVAAGVARESIIVDPGIGFAKRAEHSYRVLAQLERLVELDRPILVGPSRKSFLRDGVGVLPPGERDWGTAAAVAASIMRGAHVVRVHAVREMAQVVGVIDRVCRADAAAPG